MLEDSSAAVLMGATEWLRWTKKVFGLWKIPFSFLTCKQNKKSFFRLEKVQNWSNLQETEISLINTEVDGFPGMEQKFQIPLN